MSPYFLLCIGLAGVVLAVISGISLPNSWAVAGWPLGLFMFYQAFKGLLDRDQDR